MIHNYGDSGSHTAGPCSTVSTFTELSLASVPVYVRFVLRRLYTLSGLFVPNLGRKTLPCSYVPSQLAFALERISPIARKNAPSPI